MSHSPSRPHGVGRAVFIVLDRPVHSRMMKPLPWPSQQHLQLMKLPRGL